MYYLFDLHSAFYLLETSIPGDPLLWTLEPTPFLLNPLKLGMNLLAVYTFPFMYIFVFITALSILFCLAYNQNETTAFIFYCSIIMTAGYSLFFTSSLLIFFLSYEMLLIPSFFILYNFAKTRKCVEAAYLMFF